jgi:AAA family ATP:ADP antiporter
MSTLRGLLDVRREERRNTFAAFATLLALTSGHTLLETARDALFLSKVPAAQLPWMYLVIVALALGLTRVRTADGKGVIVGVLLTGAAVTTGFWFLMDDSGGRAWVLRALYVWSGLFASWVTVQFWTLLGRVHTMTQAKRLYGFIGAGAVLGAVIGAFAARAALAFVPPRAMLLTSAALFFVASVPVAAIRPPESSPDVPADAREARAPAMMTGANLLWKDVFARRVLGLVLVSTVTVTLVDFLFKSRIAAEYTDTHQLAARLSTFYAVTNTTALVAQVVVGPWIFRTVGVQRALFLFPLLLLGAASGVLASGGMLATAVLLKGLDGSLRYSVQKTSMELLLVPIPDGTRERVKPIIELLGTRGGQALASIAIIALVALGASNILVVAAFVVTLAVLWLANVVTIRGHYLDVFRETLRTGGLSGKVELPELDLGALEMLFAGLSSSRDSEVLASLELLADQHRERLIPALILYHPSRDVVLRALELFTHRRRTDFLSIADRLNGHPDREVAAAALRARTAVAPDRALLERRLGEPCARVSATALIALMARDWIDSAEADRRILEAIATRSWQTATELARAIRDIASDDEMTKGARERFDELLIRLAREAGSFRDVDCGPLEGASQGEDEGSVKPLSIAAPFVPEMSSDVRVRLEVARAMATRRSPAFLPILVGMLNRHELRSTARTAIALIPGALEFVDEVMRQRDFARDVRVHLPRTMVLFEPEAAARKLMAHLVSETDGAVRFKVIRALVKLRRANPKLFLEGDLLRRVVESTLDHAEELHRWGLGLSGSNDEDVPPASLVGADPLRASHHLLLDLVRDKERHARQRLFMLFELLYGEDFDDIERGLRSRKPKTRASSLELLENLIRPPLRARVLDLVGEGPIVTALPSYEEVLAEILTKASSTMRTLAEYRAVELGLDVGAITGTIPAAPPTIESLGKRLVDRARDLLTAEPQPMTNSSGVTRAPA